MSGNWITNQQVGLYMNARKQGSTQVVASAKAGISERSGRDIEGGQRKDPRKKESHHRTRKDPLGGVWESECTPLLESIPMLQPITLLEYLQGKYLDDNGGAIYPDSILRTLQRRVKEWKVLHGPKQEVMFRQEHPPGRLGLSDFTKLKDVKITIRGIELKHLLYHFRLAYSGWSHIKVILGGESFAALTEGLQEALWRLGGAPQIHRTDSLSSAFKNITKQAEKDVTNGYENFCSHYSMKPTRNNLGAKHENGSIESPHGHIKRRLKQALLLRGNTDFDSVEEYQAFVDAVVNQSNRRNAKAVTIEHEHLQPLPPLKTIGYTEVVASVTNSCTIDVRRVTYTVPSQLKSEVIRVRLYDDRLVCYLGARKVCELKRIYTMGSGSRGRQIDYRHVIHSLVKKPQAFRHSRLRDDLLPTPTYKNIWEYVDKTMPPTQACKFIVGLLFLAATENCETQVGEAVFKAMSQQRQLRLEDFKKQFGKPPMTPPNINVKQHHLKSYSYLIPTLQETRYEQ